MKWPDSNIEQPDILQSSDIENNVTSQALFAGKFDVKMDVNVLDSIDKNRDCKAVKPAGFVIYKFQSDPISDFLFTYQGTVCVLCYSSFIFININSNL